MGRWFRRKDKDRKKSRAESEAALEESQGAVGEATGPEQIEAEPPEPDLQEIAEEIPAELPEEPLEEVSEPPRRGFFARFRKARPVEEPELPELGEAEEEPHPSPEVPPEEFPPPDLTEPAAEVSQEIVIEPSETKEAPSPESGAPTGFFSR